MGMCLQYHVSSFNINAGPATAATVIPPTDGRAMQHARKCSLSPARERTLWSLFQFGSTPFDIKRNYNAINSHHTNG